MILWCTGTIAAVLLLGLVGARPTMVLGVDGHALQNSVGGLFVGGGCDQSARTWSCRRYDDQFSGTVSYRVSVNRLGCWKAIRVRPPGEGSKKRISGCVTVAVLQSGNRGFESPQPYLVVYACGWMF